MNFPRLFRYPFAVALLMLAMCGAAAAQASELTSLFEVDPVLALNGFAVFTGAIVLLFEAYRSRP